MDILTFLSTVIGNLAWPLIVVSIFCLFRSPLTELINAIKEAKFKISKGETTIEAELNTIRKIIPEHPKTSVSKEIKKTATLSPTKAIEESWQDLEKTIATSVSLSPTLQPIQIAAKLIDRQILGEKEAEALYKLYEIKDKVLNSEYESFIDVSSASTYSSLATSLSDIISKKSS